MKKILLIVVLSFTHTFMSQSLDSSTIFSHISPNRDTLFLAKTHMGYMIYKSWDNVSNDKKPVIIFKRHNWVIEERLNQNKDEK